MRGREIAVDFLASRLRCALAGNIYGQRQCFYFSQNKKKAAMIKCVVRDILNEMPFSSRRLRPFLRWNARQP